jgi:beta-lactam-binding protein with PASTA domain
MKDVISLLAAILGLSTAVIVLLAALNKTDTVEVPVIREVSVLQPSNPPPAAPTTTESTETPTDTTTVPELVGSTLEEAENTLAELDLVAESGEAAATELCESKNLLSGQVESTDPSVGMPLEDGETTVTLHICE